MVFFDVFMGEGEHHVFLSSILIPPCFLVFNLDFYLYYLFPSAEFFLLLFSNSFRLLVRLFEKFLVS